ncbi:MAG TPA: hypothetical protein VF629_03755 [Hymenobacter sp.]|jgi:hypothetical protein
MDKKKKGAACLRWLGEQVTRARRNEPWHGVLRPAQSDCSSTHATPVGGQ